MKTALESIASIDILSKASSEKPASEAPVAPEIMASPAEAASSRESEHSSPNSTMDSAASGNAFAPPSCKQTTVVYKYI